MFITTIFGKTEQVRLVGILRPPKKTIMYPISIQLTFFDPSKLKDDINQPKYELS